MYLDSLWDISCYWHAGHLPGSCANCDACGLHDLQHKYVNGISTEGNEHPHVYGATLIIGIIEGNTKRHIGDELCTYTHILSSKNNPHSVHRAFLLEGFDSHIVVALYSRFTVAHFYMFYICWAFPPHLCSWLVVFSYFVVEFPLVCVSLPHRDVYSVKCFWWVRHFSVIWTPGGRAPLTSVAKLQIHKYPKHTDIEFIIYWCFICYII